MARDWLPKLKTESVKLFAVGIGSAESARKLCEGTGFPEEFMFVDDSQRSDAYGVIGTRNSQWSEEGKQVFEGVGSMWSGKTNAAIKERGRDDLNSILKDYKPLMPATMEQMFVQGGTFVFDGSNLVFEHFDDASGVHARLDDVVSAARIR